MADIIVFAINAGLRQSEILNLKWSQIDMERRTLTIFEQKNSSVDPLPLNKTVMVLLREKLALNPESLQSAIEVMDKTGNLLAQF